MARKKSDGDFAVGYRKPPKDKQFKKGQSGNPPGRPIGSKNNPRPDETASIIEEEGRALIELKIGGKVQKMPTIRALTKVINASALGGNTRAQKIAMDLFLKTENQRRDENNMRFEAAHKMKEQWAEESKRRKQLGLPEPEFYRHPDNYILDYATGEVHYVGMSPEHEKLMRMAYEQMGAIQAALWQLTKEVDNGNLVPDHLEMMLGEFAHATHLLRGMMNDVGLGWRDELASFPDWREFVKLRDKVMNDLKKTA